MSIERYVLFTSKVMYFIRVPLAGLIFLFKFVRSSHVQDITNTSVEYEEKCKI